MVLGLAALIAFGATRFHSIYQGRQLDLTGRVDELVKLVRQYADESALYWSKPAADPLEKTANARIMALDHEIGALLRFVVERHPGAFNACNGQFDTLHRLATGDSFGEYARKEDVLKSAQILRYAGLLTTELRRGRTHRIGRIFSP